MSVCVEARGFMSSKSALEAPPRRHRCSKVNIIYTFDIHHQWGSKCEAHTQKKWLRPDTWALTVKKIDGWMG